MSNGSSFYQDINIIPSAFNSLTPSELTAFAVTVISALPASALSTALTTMIETLPTDASATGPLLWNNGGTPQYS